MRPDATMRPLLEGLMDTFTIEGTFRVTVRPVEASMLDCRAGVKNRTP
jgi:hypothetical protein